jgi:hypothetical protein
MHDQHLRTGSFLLPAPHVNPAAWACVACDQFTSQPDYWQNAEAVAAGKPSALHLVLPESYLPDAQARVPLIHQAMRDALAQGTLAQGVHDGFVLVERVTQSGTHAGLLALVDLESYDYRAGSHAPVRATEGTIISRIPPRLAVRRGAALELSHVLLLIDDPQKTVVEPLFARRNHLHTLYDFPLMLGGGHLRGYAVSDENDIEGVFAALHALKARGAGELLYAVGDGNHSLATAKAYWEELKPAVPEAEREAHPARYAMVEVQNIHSEALVFEPIHRVLFGIDGDDLLPMFQAWAAQRGWTLADGADGHPIQIVYEGKEVDLSVDGSGHPLAVGALQAFLDDLLPMHPEASLDYVHGEEAARALAMQERTVAFLLPAMPKEMLFQAVETMGSLPRKTFSMGEAHEKRYYMEARRLER